MFNSPPGYAYDDQGRPVPVCGFEYPDEAGHQSTEERLADLIRERVAQALDEGMATALSILGRDNPDPERLHLRFQALSYLFSEHLSEERNHSPAAKSRVVNGKPKRQRKLGSIRDRASECEVGVATFSRELGKMKAILRGLYSERVNRSGEMEH